MIKGGKGEEGRKGETEQLVRNKTNGQKSEYVWWMSGEEISGGKGSRITVRKRIKEVDDPGCRRETVREGRRDEGRFVHWNTG